MCLARGTRLPALRTPRHRCCAARSRTRSGRGCALAARCEADVRRSPTRHQHAERPGVPTRHGVGGLVPFASACFAARCASVTVVLVRNREPEYPKRGMAHGDDGRVQRVGSRPRVFSSSCSGASRQVLDPLA